MDQIKGASPGFFEKLVVDLLLAMGYGGSIEDAGRVLGESGDGGIDGIITTLSTFKPSAGSRR